MKKSKTDRIRTILNPYLKIKVELNHPTTSMLREYMVKLVIDDTEFSMYLENPKQKLTEAGISLEEIDIPMITKLIEFLRERMSRHAYMVQATTTVKETEIEQQYNFDHSESRWWGRESNCFRTRGIMRTKEKGEYISHTKNFDRAGIFRASLLHDDLDLAFFPSQPLVSQELLDKILEVVGEEDTL